MARPRKWTNDAERMRAKREADRAAPAEQAPAPVVSIVNDPDYLAGFNGEQAPLGKTVPFTPEEKRRTLNWAHGVWARQAGVEESRSRKVKADFGALQKLSKG